jgi:predicted nucleic acid-binding protein
VLAETELNLLAKFPASALARHEQQQSSGTPLIAFVPRLNFAPRRHPAINAKDEHVVAAALTAEADFILTLDQDLCREINAAVLPVSALSPGEFIATKLPQHPDFARLRTSR